MLLQSNPTPRLTRLAMSTGAARARAASTARPGAAKLRPQSVDGRQRLAHARCGGARAPRPFLAVLFAAIGFALGLTALARVCVHVEVADRVLRAGQSKKSASEREEKIARQPLLSRSPLIHSRPPAAAPTTATAAPPATSPDLLLHTSSFPDAGLSATVTQDPASGDLTLRLACDPPVPGRSLHWGLDGWSAPPADVWPAGTTAVDAKAVQSPFDADGSGLTLMFEASSSRLPSAVVFVLREPDGGWLSPAGGRDGRVPLRPPSADDVLARIVASEADPAASSLFTRFCAANDLLDEAASCGPEGVAALLAWLRLSSTRVLAWYGGHCYQTKDAAHVQKNLVERVAALAAAGPPAEADPAAGEVRSLARRALATLPRGGGGGDDIRMGILHIMRDHGKREGSARAREREREGEGERERWRRKGRERDLYLSSPHPKKHSHSHSSPFSGIREGHRPGLDEPFLEQWHQKLHTSTTPEDVTICEAYLDVLRSDGSDPEGTFFGSLWDRAGISRADLAGMARPLTSAPMYLPHMAGAFEGYLWTLKATHGGADLETAATMARGALGDDLAWAVGDLVSNRDAWWAPGKAVELREAVLHLVRPEHGGMPNRDVALLDAALEDFVRLGVERTDLASLSTPDLVSLARLVLRSADVGRDSVDISRVRALWDRLGSVEGGGEGDKAWCCAALAACQRASLALAASADRLTALTQPVADAFRAALVPTGKDEDAPAPGLKAAAIAGFGEEVARGAPVAVLATVLRALEPRLRTAAGVGPWDLAAPGPMGGVAGTVTVLATLAEVQGATFEGAAGPAVLIAAGLDGSEDIPAGVVAVLTAAETDVLSHVAIRARAQGVLLASCADPAVFEGLQGLTGSVRASVSAGGDVVVRAAAATAAASPSASASASSPAPPCLTLAAPTPSKSWALAEAEFAAGTVGGKALNLAALRASAAGSAARLPASVALPFGTCERVLADPVNAATSKTVAGLEAELKTWMGGGVPPQLAALRAALAGGLAAPPALVAELDAKAAAAGLAPAGSWDGAGGASAAWAPVWAAITGVWASKWGARAWLSRRATGVPDAALSMAVLLQEVIPAAHAFVLHTTDPLTGDTGCVYGEVVLGMGEALVGNAPGRAAAFRAPKDGGGPIDFLAWPAKRDAWWSGGGLIARSDSNGEDLADFAGAGLYDSVPVGGLVQSPTDLAGDEVLWWGGEGPGGLGAGGARGALLGRLRDVGVAIEAACGGVPQDVEGVVTAEGEIAVVQARAQV